MSDSWPVKVCLHMPSRTSQSLAEASQAPETNNRESGYKDKLMTSPVWPANVVVCWPVSMSQSALEREADGRLSVTVGRTANLHWSVDFMERVTHQVVSPELVTIWLSSRKRQQDKYPERAEKKKSCFLTSRLWFLLTADWMKG